jgi:hypothetical protein
LARWISFVVLQQICHQADKNVDDIGCNETMRQSELFVMMIKNKKVNVVILFKNGVFDVWVWKKNFFSSSLIAEQSKLECFSVA